MAKHPHHLHLALFILLLALEFTVFKGHGIISTLGNLGMNATSSYADALGGNDAGMLALVPTIITFVAALVIYYLLAGAIILVFSFFRKKEPAK